LFEQDGSDETPDSGLVGEDADDLGAPLDLAVEAFDRIGGVQLGRCEVGTFGSEALPASHCISLEPRNLATADDGTCTHFVEKIRNIGAIMRPSVAGNRLGQVGFGQSIFAGRCSRDNANGSHPHIHKRLFGLRDLAP
jgi:hypothetical protein